MYGWEVKPEESRGGGDAMAVEPQMETVPSEGSTLQPVLQYQAHADAVNGIRYCCCYCTYDVLICIAS